MSGYYTRLFDRKLFLTAFRLQNLDKRDEIDNYLPNYKFVYHNRLLRYYYRLFCKKTISLINIIKRERRVFEIVKSWEEIDNIISSRLCYK